jgi:hypothetical protein
MVALWKQHLWPNSADPIRPLKLKLSSTSTRYLNLHINLDLDWTDQIRHMTGTIMATVTSLLYHRINPLQGFLLLKKVIAQKLELGFCQAYTGGTTRGMGHLARVSPRASS